jgi:integrase
MAPYIRHLTERGNARHGFFADYEVRSVLANLPSYLKDFALFAHLTGWRRGEIASLQWEDVDGDHETGLAAKQHSYSLCCIEPF